MSKRVAACRREGFYKRLVEAVSAMTVWWREGWRLEEGREFVGWRGGRGRLVAAAPSLHCYTSTIAGGEWSELVLWDGFKREEATWIREDEVTAAALRYDIELVLN